VSVLTDDDRLWLDAAVRIAEPLLGTTAENPTVGAIVVDPATGFELSQAVTAPGGRPHAEPQALDRAGQGAVGATLYVTLEPCHHWGRTPPCVDAVLHAGIKRVVIGCFDPDVRTAGRSARKLADAGLEVVMADHAPSRRLHEGFFMRQRDGRPFITTKLAVSADGKIGRRDQGNVAITGDVARAWTHLQRATSDAVLVGSGTAMIDDPKLTVRVPGWEHRTPLRLVLSGAHPIDTHIELIAGFTGYPVAVITTLEQELEVPPSVSIIRVPGHGGRPDLSAVMQALGQKGIGRLFVEGGAILNDALLDAGLVDRFHWVMSSVIIGPEGVPATAQGSLANRLHAAGLTQVDQNELGADKVLTFERN
jgi:diaminohydroxyphosphoribosylaminopyrimidine deaminase/5-amino-6-(5-phosphoribosylamino)uracil reductase